MKLVARACFEWVLVSISKPFSGFGSDIMLYTHKACVCVHHFFDPNLEWLHYHGSLWQALDGVRLMTVLYRFLWVSLKVGHPYKALVYEHFFLLELPFLGIHHCWPNPTCGINSYKLYIYICIYIRNTITSHFTSYVQSIITTVHVRVQTMYSKYLIEMIEIQVILLGMYFHIHVFFWCITWEII